MPHLLFVDDRVPVPSLGAGYPRAAKVLQAIDALGWSVTIFPMMVPWSSGQKDIQNLPAGISVSPGGPPTLMSLFQARITEFDAVLVSRPHNMKAFLKVWNGVPASLRVPVLYDAEAVFAERDAGLARLQGNKAFDCEKALEAEFGLAAKARTVFSVSRLEAGAFSSHGHPDVRVLGHSLAPRPLGEGPETRRDMLFVGALDDENSPNTDSLAWFVSTIMPLIDNEIGSDWRLQVAGRSGARSVQALAGPRVHILGRIDDLDPLYERARVLIAPTRFAAGIPMKVHEAASVGLPVVATDLLTRQLGWTHGQDLLSASSAADFAACCVDLYRDDVLWSKLRRNGIDAIRRDCSPDAFAETLHKALLDSLVVSPTRSTIATEMDVKQAASATVQLQDVLREVGRLKREGRTDDALSLLMQTVADRPQDADARFACGISLLEVGRYSEAYHQLQLGLNARPGDPAGHAMIAKAAMRLRAPHTALHHSELALAKSPRTLVPLAAMAEAQMTLGRLEDARNLISRLSASKDHGAVAEDLTVNLQLASNDYENGLLDLARLCEADVRKVGKQQQFNYWFQLFHQNESGRFRDFLSGLGLEHFIEDRRDEPHTPAQACVDIIIPVYNALDDVRTCLDSIGRWPDPLLGRIILVDDRSRPETAYWLQDYANRHDKVLLVRNEENLGFTRTMVRGISESSAPVFVMLNSDTIVTPGWLTKLWSALWSDGRNAMSGPLSNDAYFQSIIQSGDPDPDPDVAAGFVLAKSRRSYPKKPLMSGFCLMVNRDRYEEVGGLDVLAFPRAYFEVQDLAFRLLDRGYLSCVADDAYVHHSYSRSIEAESRSTAVIEGRKVLVDRHGAIRVLSAEALSAMNEGLVYHRSAFSDLMKERKLSAPKTPQDRWIGLAWRKDAEIAWLGQDVCLFVSHAPHGAPLPYTLKYLEALRNEGVRVLLCLIVDDLAIPIAPEWSDHADGVVLRENGGYDFAAWADMLRLVPDLWNAGRLIFANDSIIGPFAPMTGIMRDIRARNAGFFALSDSRYPDYHAQSFFFGWAGKNLSDPMLRNFWGSITVKENKADVIEIYEKSIEKLSRELADQATHIVFGMKQLFGIEPEGIVNISPSHHAWRRMLDAGYPFIKTDLLRDEAWSSFVSGWRDVLPRFGVDIAMVELHIEGSRLNRITLRPSPLS